MRQAEGGGVINLFNSYPGDRKISGETGEWCVRGH